MSETPVCPSAKAKELVGTYVTVRRSYRGKDTSIEGTVIGCERVLGVTIYCPEDSASYPAVRWQIRKANGRPSWTSAFADKHAGAFS